MKTPEFWQVRVAPADATPELIAALEGVVGIDDDISRRVLVRLYLAKVLHPIGIHHWVPYNTFDLGSNRVISHPNKWVCTECPKGKIA